jgi:hypothetical protein
MTKHLLKSFALAVMLCSAMTLSAATYCDALITSTQAVHTAHITCSSLGGNQYQFVFESTDAFVKYNDGSNFFMNVNGVGGYHASKNLTKNGDTLSVIIESNVAPTIYAGDFFVQYEDGEAWFKLPIDADFSQVCDGSDTPDTPDNPDTPDTPDTPEDLQEGACSGTAKGVDSYYTEADPNHAITSLEKGFYWQVQTTTAGVNITVQFLDNLPGMASPYLFRFDQNGVMMGGDIQMAGWDATTRTATHTLTGLANGEQLVFLVKVALEAGKVLFTERVSYTVGENCETTDIDNVATNTAAKKVIQDGQIYIIHNGIRYNALGMQIK